MEKENLFYTIFLLTIVIMRVLIVFVKDVDIKLGGQIIHHFWFGASLFIIALIIHNNTHQDWMGAIGLGLMADQLVFMLLGAGGDKEYWATPSLFGALVLAIAVYPAKRRLTKLLFPNKR